MPILKRTTLTFFGLLMLNYAAVAQATRTPFSAFGIGEYYGNALAHNQGMAGVGFSNPQYYFLNNQNPALLVFNTITVFEAGLVAERRTTRNSSASEKNGSGNLNYLALGMPLKRGRVSSAIGLMPYTNVNYLLNYTEPVINSDNTVNVRSTGSGGIDQAYWSTGVAINKFFSVGVKASYLFGSIVNEHANALTNTTQGVTFIPNIYERYNYSDFDFQGGVSLHFDSVFNTKYKFNIGAVYDFKTNMNTKYTARIDRRNAAGLLDSVTIVPSMKGNTVLPPSVGGGISFSNSDKFSIGADVLYLDYSQFKDFKNSSEGGKAGWRYALGTEFTPNSASLSNYLKRITYRTGISYVEYPYLINGSPLKDFGINFGFSLPVNRISSLDIGLKAGKRGNLQTNTIEEKYIKLYFGVTFNDQWFIKRKFD